MSSRPAEASTGASPCYASAVRRASRIITRIYDDALAPSGLNLTQFGIAYHLQQHGPQTISQLAAWSDTEKTAMGRNLLPMQRHETVAVVRGQDRRSRVVTLTAKGRQQLEQALPLWQTAQQTVEASIGKTKAADLRGLLQLFSETN